MKCELKKTAVELRIDRAEFKPMRSKVQIAIPKMLKVRYNQRVNGYCLEQYDCQLEIDIQ